jgi:hypothetical protein
MILMIFNGLMQIKYKETNKTYPENEKKPIVHKQRSFNLEILDEWEQGKKCDYEDMMKSIVERYKVERKKKRKEKLEKMELKTKMKKKRKEPDVIKSEEKKTIKMEVRRKFSPLMFHKRNDRTLILLYL